MKRFVMLIALALCVGCDAETEQNNLKVNTERDRESLLHPELVGTLPDGQGVYRATVCAPRLRADSRARYFDYYDHHIYLISGDGTNFSPNVTTINTEVSSGKTTENSVQVLVNGKIYVEKQ